jgi:hypothetical protein
MPVTSTVSAPLTAQVLLNVIRTDSLKAYPATYYMVQKMAATSGVLLDGPPAEIALAHVFAQCDQPTINLLSGNFCLRGEAVNRMMRGGKGLRIMRRKIGRKRPRPSPARVNCA